MQDVANLKPSEPAYHEIGQLVFCSSSAASQRGSFKCIGNIGCSLSISIENMLAGVSYRYHGSSYPSLLTASFAVTGTTRRTLVADPNPRWGKQLEAPLTPSIEATVQYSFTWHTTIEATVEYSLTRQGTIEATEKKTHRGVPAPIHSITPLRSYQRQNPGYSQFNQISSNWIMRWQSPSTSPPHMLDGWSKNVMKQDHYTQSKITLLSSHIICRGHF